MVDNWIPFAGLSGTRIIRAYPADQNGKIIIHVPDLADYVVTCLLRSPNGMVFTQNQKKQISVPASKVLYNVACWAVKISGSPDTTPAPIVRATFKKGPANLVLNSKNPTDIGVLTDHGGGKFEMNWRYFSVR